MSSKWRRFEVLLPLPFINDGRDVPPTMPTGMAFAITFSGRVLDMLTIEVEHEEDGRWIAEVTDLPGVLAYGQTHEEAVGRAQALALRVLADRLEHGESVPDLGSVFAVAP